MFSKSGTAFDLWTIGKKRMRRAERIFGVMLGDSLREASSLGVAMRERALV